jgi:hypothetical protein
MDGSTKTISMKSDKIVQDETYARSAVIKSNGLRR